MEQNNIFDWLVKYHCERNLKECSPYIEDGVIYHPANMKKAVKEGKENKAYEGILIFKNGNTLLDRLVRDRLVNSMDISKPIDVDSIDKFLNFMSNREEEDGVFVYESARGKMMRVSKVKDLAEGNTPLKSKLPSDFIFYDGVKGNNLERVLRGELGTKTRLAMDITERYPDVNAYQIKRSAYTRLGMGKVTHFNSNGLVEEYFLKPEELNLINGVYRRYEPSAQGPVKKEQTDNLCVSLLREAA